ncbi:MAG: hypothetical protein EBR40_03170 [Proteobacteria bacterium]|nr:hypothetical protein [Pseudomonadota bacterium]
MMDVDTARSNYNRICGLISILEDMRLRSRMRMDPSDLQDELYLGSLGDVVDILKTLQERTPWAPTEPKPGEGYL